MFHIINLIYIIFSMNKIYGIIISLIAGLSTLIGYLFIYIKGDKNKIISRCLSFAGGVMIMLSVIDLLPSSIENLYKENSYFKTIIFSFLCFWIGFFGCHFISKLMHNESSKLYKTGIISMLGIVLHNIPEGIATFVLSAIDLKLGLFLAIAIILHNVPEGIGIAIPIFYSTNSKKNAFLYTFISGISEPLGGLFALLFLYKYINNSIIGFLFSFIAGLMIYIGYFELLKTSRYYDNKKNTFLYSFIGMIFIIIVEVILKLS